MTTPVSTVSNEIQNLRHYLTLPAEEVPAEWRVFVAEYRKQLETAKRYATSDSPDLQRRGRLMQANLDKQKEG